MAGIVLERSATAEPITLEEARLFLRNPSTEDDPLINSLIVSAREYCESFTRRSFCNKGYVQMLDAFPYYTDTLQSQQSYPPSYYSLPRYSTTLWNYSQMIKLMFAPVVSVDHIDYLDSTTGRWKALTIGYDRWFPLAQYAQGDKITDSNGNVQEATTVATDGISGKAEPTWGATASQTTVDGGITWTCTGDKAETSDYVVSFTEPPRIFPVPGKYWPAVLYSPDSVRIHFTAGYGENAEKMPEVLKTAMKQFISHWYEHREAATPENLKTAPNSVDQILWNNRVLDMAPTQG